MKNALKLITLLLFVTLFFSCTPQPITDNESDNKIDISATGGDNSSTVDDDRDGD